MEASLWSLLLLGFGLGIKHAIEPDHVIAVSTIASRSKKLSQSSMAGVFWGIGHSVTMLIVGMVLIISKFQLPETWVSTMEIAVGLMIIYFGLTSMWAHRHQVSAQAGETGISPRSQWYRSIFIGTVHGLAGSAALVLLTLATVDTWWQGALYMLIFGGGTVAGMFLFTTLLGMPFVMSQRWTGFHRSFVRWTGTLSMLFGVYYIYAVMA
ncbi:HoxN/HupN/NixA family nickel/cobalt transporter [Marinicrinis sediminis]|uniref:Nickel/cobalt efflux system n=1 Tax=Marinicrinis sediminis TaxID=1652465 RepID=A0ABW5RGA0_9BACL